MRLPLPFLERTPASGPSLEERALGAYLGFAVGDALGATVEFLTKGEIREKYGLHRKMIGGGWLHLAPGQMTAHDVIAQCEALSAIGVDHAIFNMPNVHEIAPLELFGREIIPAVAGF